MEKTICPVCGSEVEIKKDRKGRPFFRCVEGCKTVVFTYSPEGAEALASGEWPFARGGEPEPPKPKPVSRPTSGPPEIGDLVQEIRRIGGEVKGLKTALESGSKPSSRSARKKKETAVDALFA